MKGERVLMKKIFSRTITIICAIALIWFVASFVDVNVHNMSDFDYAAWNMFQIIF